MAAFVSSDTGAASRSVTVAAGTDRLLVAVALSTADTAARSATYNGVAMQVAQTDNGWAQIFYMLSPPVGSATLAVTGANVSTVVAAHYTGVGSFHLGQEATGAASASFAPTMGGLIVFGMVASSTSHTPVASTNERLDSGGDYYADRIVAAGGSVTVGVSSATDPDYAGAIFRDSVNVSGTLTAPLPTVTGSTTGFDGPEVDVGGSIAAPRPSVSGSVSIIVGVSGNISAPSPTVSGAVAVGTETPHASASIHRAASSASVVEPIARARIPRARGSVTEN